MDVVDEELLRVVLVDSGGEPFGKSLVPDEVVSADLHLMGVGEGDEAVGVGEGPGIGGGAEVAQLEAVLWHDDAVLPGDEGPEGLIVGVIAQR